MITINSSGKTDVGVKRLNNEDAYLVRPDLDLFTVADGMGGAAAGEVASGIFIDTAREIFERFTRQSEQDTYSQIQEVFRLANERMNEYVRRNPYDRGMGCTVEVLSFFGDSYIVGHVGDSRTYLFREGRLKQLTKDHSLVQEQLDSGLITPDEAKKHTLRNVVLRAVGVDTTVSLDLVKGKCAPGDLFLLCSDGLSDMIDDSQIADTLMMPLELADMAGNLVEKAKAAGGNDNITVVLCEVLDA